MYVQCFTGVQTVPFTVRLNFKSNIKMWVKVKKLCIIIALLILHITSLAYRNSSCLRAESNVIHGRFRANYLGRYLTLNSLSPLEGRTLDGDICIEDVQENVQFRKKDKNAETETFDRINGLVTLSNVDKVSVWLKSGSRHCCTDMKVM